MTHAYDECYLPGAKRRLGLAMHYAINECGVRADLFAQAFVSTGFARGFGEGDPWVVAGMSGYELARRVLEESGILAAAPPPSYAQARTPEHWAGYVLARWQWETGVPYSRLFRAIPLAEIVGWYALYHEMPESQFCDEVQRRLAESDGNTTPLARMRKARGVSQTRLAELSAVGIRSIRAYEQHENDIRKAQGKTLLRLSRVLGCDVEDLLA